MNRPIGIFDSGIGGISILEEIQKILPDENIIYLADHKNFPYGSKTPEQIKGIAEQNVKWLLRQKCKVIVVACNTATVHSIKYLRDKFADVEFIGVEPAIKPAGEVSKKGVLILSSPKTALSEKLEQLISDYSKNVPVYSIGSLELVEAIEKSAGLEEAISNAIPNEILDKIDCVVLGCTHFPLVKTQIQNFAGKDITVFDSGSAVAKRLKSVLETKKILEFNTKPKLQLFTTSKTDKIFLKYKFKPVKFYYTYLVECSDGSLYCGYTTDLEKRIKNHNESKSGAKYTRNKRPVVLKYYEVFSNLSSALKKENQLKGLPRSEKLNLTINKVNP